MLSRMHFFLRESVFRCRKIELSWLKVYRVCRLYNQDPSQRLRGTSSFCNLVLPATRCECAGPPSCRCCDEVRLARSPEGPEHYPNVLRKAELFARARALLRPVVSCMVTVRSHGRGEVLPLLVFNPPHECLRRTLPRTWSYLKNLYIHALGLTSQASPTINSIFLIF